jgi:ribosomal protein L11 methyltransferase
MSQDTRTPRTAAKAGRFVRLDVRTRDAATAERASAEAWSAGASGCEEREIEGGGTWVLVYAPAARAGALRHHLVEALAGGAEVGPIEPVGDEDWSEAWRAGLGPVEISPRLVIRPPFAPFALKPGQREVVIDPGQAFGTGGHASTRLALELLDALPGEMLRGARVLDVGTGSGVLALAALRLGAATAVGFDLDPLAAEAASAAARANGVADRGRFFTGPIDAIAEGAAFDVVVANLLKNELLPVASAIAARARPGAAILLAGLLEAERAEIERRFAAEGAHLARELVLEDATGDRWLGLFMRR